MNIRCNAYLKTTADHAIYGITTTSTDTDDFDPEREKGD